MQMDSFFLEIKTLVEIKSSGPGSKLHPKGWYILSGSTEFCSPESWILESSPSRVKKKDNYRISWFIQIFLWWKIFTSFSKSHINPKW